MSGDFFGERIRETTATTGTGAIALAGASTGAQAFASTFATGELVEYVIDDGSGNWEVGLGVFTAPSTISRDDVIASSNAGARVSFAAGTKSVLCGLPADAAGAAGSRNSVPAGHRAIVRRGADLTCFGSLDLSAGGRVDLSAGGRLLLRGE